MSYILARDTVNGAEGTVFVTVDGRNIEVASMRNIRASANIQSTDMRVIGTPKIQQKPNGVQQSGTGNIYYGDDLFRDMVLSYINTGVMPEFDIQITNSDPATSLGTQSMAFYGCHLTGDVPMAILDDEKSMLDYDFNFTITRSEKLSGFSAPSKLGND